MDFDTPIIQLKGIGDKTEALLQNEGVYTVGDILLRFPKNYSTLPSISSIQDLYDKDRYAVYGTLIHSPLLFRGKNVPIVEVKVADKSGQLRIQWFHMPYRKNQLKKGESYVFYGKVSNKTVNSLNDALMEQPEIYSLKDYLTKQEQIFPIYEKKGKLSNGILQKAILQCLDLLMSTEEYLPLTIKEKRKLWDYHQALKQIHFPSSMETLIQARTRLVYDEFFLFLMTIKLKKEEKVRCKNNFFIIETDIVSRLIQRLPYELTKAQEKCLSEIMMDLKKEHTMQRLVQGDVGSGKTIVAFLCMMFMSEQGYQSALMAPTEVLARQHYETFTKMCEGFTIKKTIILLTGSLKAKEKREQNRLIKECPDALIIGTQALIQEKVEFCQLALVITDEQHRFGVKQRESFFEKGIEPHILVMSATPIPRTLAIIIYGDMDISVIDQLPASRLANKNCVVNREYRIKAYEFMKKEVEQGHQCYVICPLVEESENLDGEDVASYTKKLQEYFSDSIRVEGLDGRMKPAKKNQIMEEFASNKIQILVSTTVVEVGVNVPNATVMMIENAERFGLAALHQLRGRVGRGKAQSYCIMINTSDGKQAKKRLEILNQSNDGFEIASQDLKLRGPGDFFGIRQSGDLGFKIADIYQDVSVLKFAAEDVAQLLEQDPKLEREENKNTAQYLGRYIQKNLERMNL